MADESALRHERASNLGAAPMLVLLALAVAVGFWLVGWLSAREEVHGFDWELASIFGTALGTTLLALATGGLAYSTRSEVRATQDLAELTRGEQITRERPVILLSGALHFSQDSSNPARAELRVQLENVGAGTALRLRLEASYNGQDWSPDITEAIIPVLRPDDGTLPVLVVSGADPPTGGLHGGLFSVRGTYWDRSLQHEYAILTDWLAS